MKSVLKELLYEYIQNINIPKDYFKAQINLRSAYDELKKSLSPEMLKLHQNFVDILENSNKEEIDFYLIEGFKLGLLIGIECASDKIS